MVRRVVVRHHRRERVGRAVFYGASAAVLYSPAPLFFFFLFELMNATTLFLRFAHTTPVRCILDIYIRIRMNWNRQKTFVKKNLKVLFVSMAGGQRHRRTNNKKGQFSDINK
jgi:hypothetical protein